MQPDIKVQDEKQKRPEMDIAKKHLLSSLAHRFLSLTNPAWKVLKGHLLFDKNTRLKHKEIKINSIFSQHEIEKLSDNDVAELFGFKWTRKEEQGRVIEVCFPGFNLTCMDTYFQYANKSPQTEPTQAQAVELPKATPLREPQTGQLLKRPPLAQDRNAAKHPSLPVAKQKTKTKPIYHPPFKVQAFPKGLDSTPAKAQQPNPKESPIPSRNLSKPSTQK